VQNTTVTNNGFNWRGLVYTVLTVLGTVLFAGLLYLLWLAWEFLTGQTPEVLAGVVLALVLLALLTHPTAIVLGIFFERKEFTGIGRGIDLAFTKSADFAEKVVTVRDTSKVNMHTTLNRTEGPVQLPPLEQLMGVAGRQGPIDTRYQDLPLANARDDGEIDWVN
jgi:hypothetical protein